MTDKRNTALALIELEDAIKQIDFSFTPSLVSEDAEAETPKSKRKAKVKQNTGFAEWYTPSWITENVRNLYGGRIDLDPMTSEQANSLVGAENFYTKDQDGLSKTWFGNVWLNPPYDTPTMNRVVEKIHTELVRGDLKTLTMITNTATETVWCRKALDLCSAAVFLTKRIKFIDGRSMKEQDSPLQGQMLTIFGEIDPALVVGLWQPYGCVMLAHNTQIEPHIKDLHDHISACRVEAAKRGQRKIDRTAIEHAEGLLRKAILEQTKEKKR